MDNLVVMLKRYLKEALAIDISVLPWKEQKKLPFFLVDTYAFFETSFLNNPCLFMISKNDGELTPSTIQKNWEQVTKKWNGPCVYISKTISSYNRNRLIRYHIPFIIPNNQIYVPDIGVDLREHFIQQRIHRDIFSPATQIVIISVLLREKCGKLIPSDLAKKLGYSLMTMTRVFNELEAAGIGEITKIGKERRWVFEKTKRDLWEETKDQLRSPIRNRESMKKIWTNAKMPQTLSGISALSQTTMINPPLIPIYAMGIEEYSKKNTPKGYQLSPIDEGEFELEIWNYNPNLLSEHGRVDPFSLYLSLRENNDERIEAALEELMEKIEW